MPTALYASANPAGHSHHFQQAEHFFRRGWMDDAESEYQAALLQPGGPESIDLQELGARIAWARLDVESAMVRSQRVAALSSDPTQARAAHARAEAYARDFGFLEIVANRNRQSANITISPNHPMLDPEIAAYTEAIQERLARGVDIPCRLALPVGSWAIEGRPFQVSAGLEHTFHLDSPVNAAPIMPRTAIDVSGGLALWLETNGAPLLPSPQTELRLTRNFGSSSVGFALPISWYRNISSQSIVQSSGARPGLLFTGSQAITTPTLLDIKPSLAIGMHRVDPETPTLEPNQQWAVAGRVGAHLATNPTKTDGSLGTEIGLSIEYLRAMNKTDTMPEAAHHPFGPNGWGVRLTLQTSMSWKF